MNLPSNYTIVMLIPTYIKWFIVKSIYPRSSSNKSSLQQQHKFGCYGNILLNIGNKTRTVMTVIIIEGKAFAHMATILN